MNHRIKWITRMLFPLRKEKNPLNPLNPMIKYLRAQREETLYKSNKFDDKNIQAQPTIN